MWLAPKPSNYYSCIECQECVQYTVPYGGWNMYPEGWYCADVCDPSPCQANETCQLVPTPCMAVVSAVCPPKATCFPSTTDPCDACGKFLANEALRGVGKKR